MSAAREGLQDRKKIQYINDLHFQILGLDSRCCLALFAAKLGHHAFAQVEGCVQTFCQVCLFDHCQSDCHSLKVNLFHRNNSNEQVLMFHSTCTPLSGMHLCDVCVCVSVFCHWFGMPRTLCHPLTNNTCQNVILQQPQY